MCEGAGRHEPFHPFGWFLNGETDEHRSVFVAAGPGLERLVDESMDKDKVEIKTKNK